MHEHKEKNDFSEYPDNSAYHNKENKRVVGIFKYVKANPLLDLLV